MKHPLLAVLLFAVSTTAYSVAADTAPVDTNPAVSFGITLPLGSGGVRDFGLSLNLLSTSQQDAWMAGAGVTFYPSNNSIGCSLLAGRNLTNVEVHLGYDFCQQIFNFGVGGMATTATPTSG